MTTPAKLLMYVSVPTAAGLIAQVAADAVETLPIPAPFQGRLAESMVAVIMLTMLGIGIWVFRDNRKEAREAAKDRDKVYIDKFDELARLNREANALRDAQLAEVTKRSYDQAKQFDDRLGSFGNLLEKKTGEDRKVYEKMIDAVIRMDAMQRKFLEEISDLKEIEPRLKSLEALVRSIGYDPPPGPITGRGSRRPGHAPDETPPALPSS